MSRLQTTALVCLALVVTLPAHGQITFRAATSATAAGITPAFRSAASATTTGATLTVTKPSGVALDDVLIGSIAVTPSSASITPPSGWTLVRRTDNAGPTSNSLAVYYKSAGASEPASYTWAISGASFTVGGVQAFTGVDTAAPIEVENGQSTASSLMHATPNITSVSANAMIVASHAFASSQAWSPPSGMTESLDVRSGSNNATGLAIEGSRVLQPLPGATGTKTATAAGTADAGNTHILALRPRSSVLTISKPSGSGSTTDDMLIASIAFNNHSAAVSGPPGWSLVRRINNSATTSNSLLIYRGTAFSGLITSFSWTITGGTFLVGGIQAFGGVSQNNPIDVEGGLNTASGTNHDTPNVATTIPNAMLVTSHTYASSNSWAPQTGLTEGFDRPSGGNSATGQSITGGRQFQAVAGATGAKRSAAGGFADAGNTHILALRPGAPNQWPSVSWTSPTQSAVFTTIPPPPITVSVDATDPDGTITQVHFNGCDDPDITTITTPPYSFIWTPPAPYYDQQEFFYYYLQARATDNFGAVAYAGCIIVVIEPTVTLSSPANGATFKSSETIQLTATHNAPGGPIQKVQFFDGTTLIGEDFTAPYTVDWLNASIGAHALTAKAVTALGAEYPSSVANITVTAAEPKLHFIEVDHLNTPRLVENHSQQAVWQWHQQEPFGNNMPDENPSGLGSFEFALRFAGQYFDKETNLSYNYFRDYDSGVGRYIQSDRIGLRGGLNTYAYAYQNPLAFTDPTGEMGAGVLVIGGGGTFIFCTRFPHLCMAGATAAAAAIGSFISGQIAQSCKADPSCQEHFNSCLQTSLADQDGSVFGSNRCLLCRDACMRQNGIWPDIAMTGGKSVRCDYWNW